MDKQDERVRFMAKLPPDLHHRLKVAAADRSVNMNDLVIEAIEMRLATAGLAGALKSLEGGRA
jgi:predicted HicB family RNase H-like nuclease